MVRRTLGQYVAVLSPSPTHLSHTRNITLSRIKCERYYFYKEVCSFVSLKFVNIVDYVSAYICICICIRADVSYYSTLDNYIWRCPWCNGYRRRKWTRRHEFKSWTRLIAFHIALIPLGKGMNPIILYSRAD